MHMYIIYRYIHTTHALNEYRVKYYYISYVTWTTITSWSIPIHMLNVRKVVSLEVSEDSQCILDVW